MVDRRSMESTATLLNLVRKGDSDARERLFAAYLPILTRWAHGRLPGYARDVTETDDLVQETLVSAFKRINDFMPKREGAFLAYLRQILINEIRDEMKRASKNQAGDTLDEATPNRLPSTVERFVGRAQIERFDRALSLLPDQHREAVILRVEFGFSFKEIAAALDCPSEDAARMKVSRALVKLVEVIQ